MARPKTRERILNAAESLFAKRGFSSTSIRAITGQAQVNQAAIFYHFGTKAALFGEVVKRRLIPINTERLNRLEEILSRGERPTTEELLRAYMLPIYRLSSHRRHGSLWRKLIARFRVESGGEWGEALALHREMTARFTAAFGEALPHLSPKEVAYRLYFVTGVMVNTLVETESLDAYDADLASFDQDPENTLKRVLAFAAAGMHAPIKTEGE